MRDSYLRHLMDVDGWVPLILLCSFPKVAREGLTLVQVVDALKLSSNVVVSAVVAEGDTIQSINPTNDDDALRFRPTRHPLKQRARERESESD